MSEPFLAPSAKAHTARILTAISGDVSTTIHLNEVPPFVEDDLQRLYGHIYSSLHYIRIFKSTDQVSTYVARQGGKPVAILLFRLGRRSIEVLNQTIQVDQEELRRFAAFAFERFPLVGVISFKAIQTDFTEFPYPLQRNHAMEDVIIMLPASSKNYTARLGKSTRSNLKYYKKKLEKDFSAVQFAVYEKHEIDEQLIHRIIKLSETRIAAKKLNFNINREKAWRITDLVKLCGVVNMIWVDGNLCAGAISYRTGAHQYTDVIAHDGRYNAYSPGMLCFYQAVCDSIAKGVTTYHMGGGRYGYKVWLSGMQQNMEQIDLYRSVGGMIWTGDRVAKVAIGAHVLSAKTWLRKHETSPPVRLLVHSQHFLKKMFARK